MPRISARQHITDPDRIVIMPAPGEPGPLLMIDYEQAGELHADLERLIEARRPRSPRIDPGKLAGLLGGLVALVGAAAYVARLAGVL